MMRFPTDTDGFNAVAPGTTPPYDFNNPLLRVVTEVSKVHLAAGRHHYEASSLQYLFPFRELALYGPGQGSADVRNAPEQNIKTDFQKQNISEFELADVQVVRGYAHAGERDSVTEWTGSFLKIRYRATPGSVLSKKSGHTLGGSINAQVKVGNAEGNVTLRLNENSGWYEVELWSFSGGNLRNLLDDQGRAAFDAGQIVANPGLVKGTKSAFFGPAVTAERDQKNRQGQGWQMLEVAPDHTMHPVRPLRVELTFSSGGFVDDNGGNKYRLLFGMHFRGWKSYLGSGISKNPHGGVGFLEFRNLFSNYFFEARREEIFGNGVLPELGRDLIPGNFDANTYGTNKQRAGGPVTADKREHFMAVDYMDLHVLQPDCGIGIHRHRDNQEVFMMLSGSGLMLVGDWCHFDDRDRAFELRTLDEGDLALCKTGQLHALFNDTDRPCSLFMFGGYD